MAAWKLGVAGLPNVGDATRLPAPAAELPEYTEPGRASREGDRPAGGKGDDERGGAPEPVYFF
jgi:hypothetical protein